MGSSYTQDLADVLAAAPSDKARLRPHVIRLTRALRERTASSDESSLQFVKTAVDLLVRAGPAIFPDDCFEGASNAAPYLYAHGEFAKALTATRLMLQIANHTGRRDFLRIAESTGGIIHRVLDNIPDAIIGCQRALAIAEELGDHIGKARALTNVGCVLLDGGLYQDARCVFEQIVSMPGPDLQVARALNYHNLALTYSRIGRRDDAIAAARKSFSEAPEPITVQEYLSRAMREAIYIYLVIELDDSHDIRRHLDLCRSYANRSGTRSADCFLTIAVGLCAVRESDQAHGLALLHKALEEARAIAHPGMMDDVLAALAWAHKTRGEPAEALRYIRLLMDEIARRRRACFDQFYRGTYSNADLLQLQYEEAKLEAAAIKLEARTQRDELLQRLAMTATLRDDPSGMHAYRVGRLSALLSEQLGWSPDRSYDLEVAARLHDIGKSALPDHILLGTSALKSAEREFVKSHPEVGASLLANASDPASRLAADIALYHHEHWNGQGYPKELCKERIPLAARIVAIANVFDALTHGRPPIERALSDIRALSGTQFDPALIDPFVDLIGQLTIRHGNLDRFLEANTQASPFLAARKKIETMILRDREALQVQS